MTDYDAREYVNSTFVKKADLRTGGPRRFTIKAVEEAEGLKGRNGQPAKKELVLVFDGDERFSLRASVNNKRMQDAYGWRTSAWIGKPLELYYSPDVMNPSNPADPGGIRVRVPDVAPAPLQYVSELDQSPQVELPPPMKAKKAAASKGVQ